MTEAPKLKKCPACNGRGYHRCDCWPGDCICSWGDETCEECGGDGYFDPDEYPDWDDLPVGSFAESGTNVCTTVATIHAPREGR